MVRCFVVLLCSLSVSFGYVPSAVLTRTRSMVSVQATSNKLTESLRNLREKLQTPPEPIIAAVERLPEVPLSVSDVAAAAGVDLNVARTELMTLASLTGMAIYSLLCIIVCSVMKPCQCAVKTEICFSYHS